MNRGGERESEQYVDIERDSFMVGPVDDWTYTMRREMQEIVPGLFLGPYAAAGKKNLLLAKS